MNKDIRKNREALIRHLLMLNDPGVDRDGYRSLDCGACVKMEMDKKFGGNGRYEYTSDLVETLNPIISMSTNQMREMEARYEGLNGHKIHKFKQIADWLQTLPGWPRVL